MRHVSIEQAECEAVSAEEICETELSDLLDQLHEVSRRIASALRPPESHSVDGPVRHRLVSEILRFRRQRDKLFGGDLFGEPAWDILLELYMAEWTGRKLSVSGACYASGVPLTTALRWISRLEKDGWIQRTDDPLDRRRSWLVLSRGAAENICELVSAMMASDPLA